jgi:hypothetical protein
MFSLTNNNNNQAFYSKASWGKLEMKLHEPGGGQRAKKKGKTKDDKKTKSKKGEDNKTLSQKSEKGAAKKT